MVDDATDEQQTVAKGGPSPDAQPPSSIPTRATIESDEGLPQVELEQELAVVEFDTRYPIERELGHGGMGTVHLCHDRQIGRHVAMKVVSPSHRNHRAVVERFVREARVQAQLEHPAVVPVYELGCDPSGQAYFTMKRIRGMTLRVLVERLADRDPELTEIYTLRKLLSDFSHVCLAVDYAHRAGVVHRDLKPSNIMLGEYGEVYVLDWGIAKSLSDERAKGERTLGTPGYMAPEQIEDARTVDVTADMYALGCVLFELLTLRRAHDAEDAHARIASTLHRDVPTPSTIAPEREIAPELDVMCMRATARTPAHRYASARELHHALEHYLDGERDLAMRRSLAETHADHARRAARRLQEHPESDSAHTLRRDALRELGQALALDPTNRSAMTTMVELLTRPPEATPPEVDERLGFRRQQWFRNSGRIAAGIYLSMLLYLPVIAWAGIRDAASIAAFFVLSAVAGALSLRAALMTAPREGHVLAAMVTSTAAMAATATLFGPLVLAPGVVAVNCTAYALTVGKRARMLTLATAFVAIGIPIALAAAGAIPGYRLDAQGMTILPHAIDLDGGPALVLLAVASLAMIATGVVAVGRLRDALDRAERQLEQYNWHFRQLLPDPEADL